MTANTPAAPATTNPNPMGRALAREERRVPAMGGFSPRLLRIELRRLLRNRRTVIFTVVMPVVFFLIFGMNEAYADEKVGRGNVSAYIMVGMALYGALIATTSGGAIVSIERAQGWSRQLRLTPLAPVAYVATKMLLALVMSAAAVLAVNVVGLASHKPSMPVSTWVLAALIGWVGSLVFAAFGLFMGYLLPSDNVMQILGPGLALLAAAGGLFTGPIDDSSLFGQIAQFTPVYGLASLVRAPLLGQDVHVSWVVNVLGWLTVFVVGAAWRFRKDTARV